ncbi:GAF domain-containing sensor histidine kinase [Streptomyces sp. YIM S03343]
MGSTDPVTFLAELVRINDVLNWSCDRSETLVDAAARIRTFVGAKLAPMFLLDPTGTQLVLVTDDKQRRMLEDGFETMPAVVHLRSPWINAEEWPVSAADHLDHESWAILPDDFKAWFGTSGIVVPIHADGRHLGAVLLAFDGDYRLEDDMRAFLAVAGRILGNALYRWQASEREQELGALQERRRLGEELHVDLAQQTAALGLQVESVRLDAESGSPTLHEGIDTLCRSVDNLQKNLRHQMLGLRADAGLVGGHLIGTVREHLENFRTQLGVRVHFVCRDEALVDDVPMAVSAQLIRVLQESLSNCHLHAAATAVTVRLSASRTQVQMEIQDNGTGFDPLSIPDSRLGLSIMRQRMEQVDGTLVIESLPGRGTLVTAKAPLSPAGHAVGGLGMTALERI